MVIPAVYAEAVWGRRLYEWQARVMNALLVEGNRSLVATCNESGKTSEVITKTILWYMDVFPGSTVVTTSASARQIEQQLYPNLRACVGALPGGGQWKIRSNNQYWVAAPNGSRCFSFTTNEAGRAEGYHVPALHAPIHAGKSLPDEMADVVEALRREYGFELKDKTRLLIVIDEAKSVPYTIFRAFERCRATNWLVASTPGEDPTGPFFDGFQSKREDYRCVRTGELNIVGGFEEFGLVTFKECPHLTANRVVARKIQQDIALLGRRDAFVRSMHFGEFSPTGSNMVFNMLGVEKCMSGMIPSVGRDRAIALDYSGGGDEQVMAYRVGNQVKIWGTWHEEDGTVLADKIEAELIRLRWSKDDGVTGDNGGLGKVVNDLLARRGWRVNRFDFGSTNTEPGYLNRRAQGFFKLSMHISLGEIGLPNDPVLKEQLSWHKYRTDENRKRRIIPKEEMPRSPDRADTVMMVIFDFQPLAPREVDEESDRHMACGYADEEESRLYEPWRQGGLLYG